MQPEIAIIIPPLFTDEDERAVLDYLHDQLRGPVAWDRASLAFDRLDEAALLIDGAQTTFRRLYRDEIDQHLAQSYLNELQTLDDLVTESPVLWARYARQLMATIRQRGWLRAGMPESRLLASYLLYWWNSFARGYAVEEEVFRDLRRNGIVFWAHDLRDPDQRYTPADLVVNGRAGDIKLSISFLQRDGPVRHDFFIVRIWRSGQAHTFVAMLQPDVWEELNGDTVAGTLDMLRDNLSTPLRISDRGQTLVVLSYEEWKTRIHRQQGGNT